MKEKLCRSCKTRPAIKSRFESYGAPTCIECRRAPKLHASAKISKNFVDPEAQPYKRKPPKKRGGGKPSFLSEEEKIARQKRWAKESHERHKVARAARKKARRAALPEAERQQLRERERINERRYRAKQKEKSCTKSSTTVTLS